MGTILFHDPVFGPIHSRRLGTSLGINLMPTQRKICNFNCIYCECGWNKPHEDKDKDLPGFRLPSVHEVVDSLDKKLASMKAAGLAPDVITFSGNGEPTGHPHFLTIMKQTIKLRDTYFPGAQVCVLSNSGYLDRPGVMEGLMLADKRIMKIDSAFSPTVAAINQPAASYSLEKTIEHLKRFDGFFTLQTLFLSGEYNGSVIDNTTPEEVDGWLEVVAKLRPREVMVYTLDRETPAPGLKKCSREKLEAIAARVRAMGINVQVAG